MATLAPRQFSSGEAEERASPEDSGHWHCRKNAVGVAHKSAAFGAGLEAPIGDVVPI